MALFGIELYGTSKAVNPKGFFSELKRRNVVRMAGLYLRFQALLKLPAAGEKDAAHE